MYTHCRQVLLSAAIRVSRSLLIFLVATSSVTAFVRSSAWAQQDAPKIGAEQTIPALTTELVEERRLAVENNVELEEALRGRIGEIYRQALDQLRVGQSFDEKRRLFQQRNEEAASNASSQSSRLVDMAKRVETAKQSLSSHQRKLEDSTYVPEEELGELEKLRTASEVELKGLRTALAQLESEGVSRANRRREVRSRLLATATELDTLGKALSAPPTTGDSAELSLAKRTEILARRQALTSEGPALEAELLAYDSEDAVDRLRIDRDVLTQNIARSAIELQIWELLVKRKGDKLANDALIAAKAASEGVKWSLNEPLAARNLELAQLGRKLNSRIAEVVDERKLIEIRSESIRREFELTVKKVENVGLPASVGAQLRNQRSTLPSLQRHRTAIRMRQPIINDAQLLLFDLDDERAKLANIEQLVRRHLRETSDVTIDRDERNSIRKEATTLLESRTGYLDPFIRNQTSYFDALTELSIAQQQLIDLSSDFADYIDEHVLWIRSGPSLFAEFDVESGLMTLATPKAWQSVGTLIAKDFRQRGFLYVSLGLLWLFMLRFSRQFRKRIRKLGEQVQRTSFVQFLPTVRVTALTIVIALTWPFLFKFLSWRLNVIAVGDEFAIACAFGCETLAWGCFFLETLRQGCRPLGLAESHFQYSEKSVRIARGSLRILIVLGLPILFVGALLHAIEQVNGRNTLERILFIAGALLVIFVSRRLIHPTRGVFHYRLALHPNSWLFRLRHVWFYGTLLFPLSLAVLSAMGYHYTAQQLAWRGFVSCAVLLLLIVLGAYAQRLLMVHRRRLSINQARLRRSLAVGASGGAAPRDAAPRDAAPRDAAPRDAAPRDAAPGDAPPENTASGDAPPENTAPGNDSAPYDTVGDLSLQTVQSRRLVTTMLVGAAIISLWIIWADVLPALDFLERWPLWHSSTQVTESTTSESGDLQTQTRDISVPITVVDLLLAILVAALALVAARNLPGLLEISILQRLPLEASVRYAITTIASYLITLVGVVTASYLAGLRWNQIQWMATALTFGLAFGLQEMFANFVAGIIILFERPVRVGDIVTIDNISGVVTQVRIRATTITDWDRKDFIVPNKDFITGRVLNWTLSDQVNRVLINVGVAYGSDTQTAKALLLQIAAEHPQVVDNPSPLATFELFGESSLTISLRCFIALKDMSSRLAIVDELHTAIDLEFKKAKIEIAFPQSDLHIRSFSPVVGVESTSVHPTDQSD